MKASELITELQKHINKSGDAEVVIVIDKNYNNDITLNLYERDFTVNSTQYLFIPENKIFIEVQKGGD
jgi:hypothetical protein